MADGSGTKMSWYWACCLSESLYRWTCKSNRVAEEKRLLDNALSFFFNLSLMEQSYFA